MLAWEKNSFCTCVFSLCLEKTDIRIIIILKIQTVILYSFKRLHESKDNFVMVITGTGLTQLDGLNWKIVLIY